MAMFTGHSYTTALRETILEQVVGSNVVGAKQVLMVGHDAQWPRSSAWIEH
jgi:hypothetical protein